MSMIEEQPERYQIKAVTQAPLAELIDLYKDAGWWESAFASDPGFLTRIAADSAVFVGAFVDKKLIGMGRALSDGVSDAYIQDVTVLKPYRGRGIGKKIIRQLVDELSKKGVDWIGLVAEPGTASFYNDLGFLELEGHIPMKYKGKK